MPAPGVWSRDVKLQMHITLDLCKPVQITNKIRKALL